VPVRVSGEPGRPKFAQLSAAMLPEFRDAPPREEIAAMLGLSPDDLRGGDWEPAAVSCGVPFLIVPLRTLDALARARLDLALWERTMGGAWARMVYPVVPDPGEAGVDFRARMYAPEAGIVEDPATGGAAAAFAGYLARREARTGGARDASFGWTVRQGVEMGRPSTLYLEADLAGGEVAAVRVGGSAVLVGEGEMEIPRLQHRLHIPGG
jgi:trans-2,3-dihydro-3-hydroxyanthranilate isomerase